MKKEDYRRMLMNIAEMEGVTLEEVERALQIAIDTGYDNPDENVKKVWAKIPCKGERPTVQEVIEAMINQLKQNHD